MKMNGEGESVDISRCSCSLRTILMLFVISSMEASK